MTASSSLFPLLYHAHHSLHNEDLSFWLELAGRQGDPILELGCGTGRVLLPLAQAGHKVYGLDHDPGMLFVLRRGLASGQTPAVHLLQADLAAFRLEQRFALVLLTCNTYSSIAADTRRSMLARVRRHLHPSGLFAASLPNPGLLSHLPRRGETEVEETFPHPLDGEPVQVSSAWERSDQVFTLHWHYDHLLPDGRVERVSAQVEHHIYPIQAYREELQAAGLEIVSMYGDFDRSPYRKNSPSLILVVSPAR